MFFSDVVRLHIDWWERCRTCRFWNGDRHGVGFGECLNKGSPYYSDRERFVAAPINPIADCSCQKWDTFDLEGAEVVLRWDGSGESPDMMLRRQGR